MTIDVPDTLVLALVRVTDEAPKPEDVTAGPWGAIMIGALVVAVVILMRSFLKQMRRADHAKAEGVYGDEPVPQKPTDDEDHPTRR